MAADKTEGYADRIGPMVSIQMNIQVIRIQMGTQIADTEYIFYVK